MPELPGPEDHRVWGRGDYSILAAGAILPSELLCEAVELRARQATLDVATGSGNTALSAARRRARVTGSISFRTCSIRPESARRWSGWGSSS